MIDKICKCGCEGIIEPQIHHRQFGMPNYIHGHHWRNRKQSPEHIAKRQVWLGRKHTEESKKKMSIANMGNTYSLGFKASEETKKRISLAKKGTPTWNKGKTGIYSKETLKIMSDKKIGDKSPTWLGGITKNPYDIDFNKRKRLFVRKRDNYTCQECNYTEEQLGYALSVHHIDYDKLNSNPTNLISLCKSCHSKTNFSREDWTRYFIEKNTWGESLSES